MNEGVKNREGQRKSTAAQHTVSSNDYGSTEIVILKSSEGIVSTRGKLLWSKPTDFQFFSFLETYLTDID
jgi:hypothetical protein